MKRHDPTDRAGWPAWMLALVALVVPLVAPVVRAEQPPTAVTIDAPAGAPEAPVTRSVPPAAQAILSDRALHQPVVATHGMVVSQEARATRIGTAILARGGNAVDAAVAVGFGLAVSLPRAGNLGGGGFLLLHRAETGETIALDYREMAPAAADADMFLDKNGDVDDRVARFSHRSAGVPGTVAGLTEALARWGTMPLAEVMAPAIALAENGLDVSVSMANALAGRDAIFRAIPASAAIFLRPDGSPLEPGDRLVQRDLAWSLRQVAEHGADAFYRGEIAARLVADMKRHEGLIGLHDLASYRTVEREPLRSTYRDYEVVSMPPPSSGGVHLIQMLNILEGFPLRFLGSGSAETYHLMAEAMKLAYADRASHLGDPGFWNVPVAGLTAKAYARDLRTGIDRHRARPSADIAAGVPQAYESPDTTHFSIVDRWGNTVTNTYTLNLSYGSGIVADGTGILLNNEMDDFSAKPGVPNAYGLVGGEANAIAPGKRPLSSMTPTIVLRDGKPYLVTGTPGGSRIITTVLQIVLNVLDHDMNVAEAVHAPRIHHQWLPEELRIERGLSPDTIALLTARGHRVVLKDAMGAAQSILIPGDGTLHGAADPRRPDALALGF